MISLLLILQVFAAGDLLLRALGALTNLRGASRLGWTILAGQLQLGLLSVLVAGLGLPWQVLRGLGVALLVVWALGAWRRRARATPTTSLSTSPTTGGGGGVWIWRATLALSCLVLGEIVMSSGGQLVVLGDEAAIWAAKAKAIWYAGTLAPEALRPALGRVAHPDYPLLNPLLQLWSFAQSGEVLHAPNRVPVQLAMFGLLALLTDALPRRRHPVLSSVVVLAVVSCAASRFLAATTMADGLIAFSFLAALLALQAARDEAQQASSWSRLAALALLMLVTAKNEGWMLLAIVLLAQFLVASGTRWRELSRLLRVAAPALVAVLAQVWLNSALEVENDLMASENGAGPLARLGTQGLEHLPIVARQLLRETVLVPGSASLLFPLALVLLLVRRGAARTRSALLVAVGLSLASYSLVYLITPRDLEWHLQTSLSRLLFHVQPALAVWLAAALTADPIKVAQPRPAGEGTARRP